MFVFELFLNPDMGVSENLGTEPVVSLDHAD
jgi:hypothetical protein